VAQRLLIIDHAIPTPDRDAGSAYVMSHLEILSGAGFAITFVAAGARVDDPYARPLRDLGIAVPDVGGPEHLLEVVDELAPSCNVALLHRAPTAAAVFDRIRQAAPAAKVLFFPVDLHHLRIEREALTGGFEDPDLERMRSMEVDLVRRADATVVVSTVERDVLESLVPGAVVHTLPILREDPRRGAADEARWRSRRILHRLGRAGRWANALMPSFRRRRDIVFLGGFAHQPNVDAMHWFVGEVLPQVRQAGVTDRFVIAGYGVPESVVSLAREDVVVAGHVPDLTALFATARMSVAPLRYGAGFKGKIVTSLSYGVPTVATSVGAEGGGLVDGHDILVADEPAAMAELIVRLSRDDDLWQSLSEAAYETFRTRFSHEAGGAALVSIVDDLASAAG
jgi:glycosyltransferase involved in cell wall biosynthesis